MWICESEENKLKLGEKKDARLCLLIMSPDIDFNKNNRQQI